MSNRASIQQEAVTIHKTGEKSNNVNIFDDYGQGSICLDDYSDKFYEDDLEVLEFVLERIKEGGVESSIVGIIDHICEDEKGIYIEGTWYDWAEIKPVFDKVKYWG